MTIKRFPRILITTLLALSALSPPAFAAGESAPSATVYQAEDSPLADMPSGQDENAPILKDVRAAEQGGQALIVKTWDVPPGYDPEQLVEADFEKNGLRYKKAYLLQVSENFDSQAKLASETMTVAHENKDEAAARFQPILEYSQGGFSGQLALKEDSIVTEAADQSSYSYAVTDVREYPGLERNDPYNVPKSVEKNGVTLGLLDIIWSEKGDGGYTATASYRGMASGTAVTGYVSTATYLGEVTKETLSGATYAVVYEGAVIPIPPPDYIPYYLAAGATVLFAVALLVFLNKRNNTKVYAMSGREFQLVHRQRLSALTPIIDLTPPEISSGSEEFMIVMDIFAARKMKGQLIKIVGKDGVIKEQRVTGVRSFHIKPNRNEEDFDYDHQG